MGKRSHKVLFYSFQEGLESVVEGYDHTNLLGRTPHRASKELWDRLQELMYIVTTIYYRRLKLQ